MITFDLSFYWQIVGMLLVFLAAVWGFQRIKRLF